MRLSTFVLTSPFYQAQVTVGVSLILIIDQICLATRDQVVKTFVVGIGGPIGGMLLVAVLMRTLVRLQSSGTLNIQNAVGVTGRVYLTIPERGSGMGKITIEVQGRSREILATTDGDALASGTPATVVEVVQGGMVKVVNAQAT